MAEKLGSALVTWLFFVFLTFTLGHQALEQRLNSGRPVPLVFTSEKVSGRTYKSIQISINFGIQGHMMTLIEVKGVQTMQEVYECLHVHDLGQSVTHQPTKDLFIMASSRFTKLVLTPAAILHYFGSKIPPSKPLPIGPNCHICWSIKLARTIRLNLIASATRPNPQGSFHYVTIPIVRILVLENTAAETKPCTYKKFPGETEPFPAETKPCTHKKFPAKTEPFPAETKPCSHVVRVLSRNRRLLGKLADVNVHSPPSTLNEKSWNLDKEDPPSPPAPRSKQPAHP